MFYHAVSFVFGMLLPTKSVGPAGAARLPRPPHATDSQEAGGRQLGLQLMSSSW